MEDQTGTPNQIKKVKRLYAALAAIIFIALIAGIFKLTSSNSGGSNQPAKPKPASVATVRITKSGFVPSTLSVKQGTRIIWTNWDNSLHQVASNPYPKDGGLPSLKSAILNNNQAYAYTANATGTFGYHDQMQPTLNGTLVVQKQ